MAKSAAHASKVNVFQTANALLRPPRGLSCYHEHMNDDFKQQAEAFGARGTLLGLDLGDKTIGVASCDPDRMVATPVTTIRRTKFTPDAERLAALAEAGYREVGDVGGVTHAQATRGKILVDLGRLEDARAVLEAATEGARALGGGPFVAAVESLRALLAPDPSGSEEGGAADSTVQ